MQLNGLASFVLLLVAVSMLLGVGIITLDKFGTASMDTKSVSNETVVLTASAGSLANSNATATSAQHPNATMTLGENINVTYAGDVTVDASVSVANDVGVTYTYLGGNGVTHTNLDSSISAVGSIGTSWLSLIVTIGILSIILTLVITSFRRR